MDRSLVWLILILLLSFFVSGCIYLLLVDLFFKKEIFINLLLLYDVTDNHRPRYYSSEDMSRL